MKVLIIEPWGRGLGHYSHLMADSLAQRGMEVTLLTSKNFDFRDLPRRYKLLDVLPIWNLDSGPAEGFFHRWARRAARMTIYCRMALGARMYANRIKPDIIHMHDLTFDFDYYFVRLLAGTGRGLVDTVHNIAPFFSGKNGEVTRRDPGTTHARRGIYLLFHALLFHTQGNLRDFENMYGDVPARKYIVPHGDYNIFAQFQTPDPRRARAALGIPDGAPVLLVFGAIRKYKGLETAIETLALLRRELPEARLLVAGSVGSDVNMESFYALARKLGVLDSIIWRLGYVPNEQVPELFAAADAALLAHREIFQSGILFVAWGMKKPIAASAVGGIAEAVEHGVTGLLFPPGDADAAAAACIRILRDPVLARSLAQAGAECAIKKYSWSAIAEQLEEIYRGLLK